MPNHRPDRLSPTLRHALEVARVEGVDAAARWLIERQAVGVLLVRLPAHARQAEIVRVRLAVRRRRMSADDFLLWWASAQSVRGV